MSRPTLAMPILRSIAFTLRVIPVPMRHDRVSHYLMHFFRMQRYDEPVSARLRSGARLSVHLNDYNGRMLFFFGTVDPRVIGTCQALVQPGDVFLDIGANHGAVGLLCAEKIGTKGAVHFVEPQPELCGKIRAATESVPCSTTIHQIGLLDEEGEFDLRLARRHTGAASLVDQPRTSDGSSIRVRVREIDSFLDETVGVKPFGAKVDVEGAENQILPQIIDREGLRFLVFECNRESTRAFVDETFLQHPERRAASIFGLVKAPVKVRLRSVANADELAAYDDLVVVFGKCKIDRDRSMTPEAMVRSIG